MYFNYTDRKKIPEQKRWFSLQIKLPRFLVRLHIFTVKNRLFQNNFVVDQGPDKPCSYDQNRQSE